MAFANRVVAAVLRSPLHRLLSRSTDLVRYTSGAGQEIITPTQYADVDDGLVILVGRPATKTWWRHFRTENDLDVLRRGRWTPMTGRALRGADEPTASATLVDAYLARFPRAARVVEGETRDERVKRAVLVWCRPRGHSDAGGEG